MLTKEEAYRIKKRLELDALEEQRDATLQFLYFTSQEIERIHFQIHKAHQDIKRALAIWYMFLLGVSISLIIDLIWK